MSNELKWKDRLINTYYYMTPIPLRQFDWTATLDGYDGSPDAPAPSCCCGTGATELDAIKDLITLLYVNGE